MTRHLDNPESCFVCRRRADGLGLQKGTRIGWLCQQCADGGYGTRCIRMPVRDFDQYETAALGRAGERAGAFLDNLGCTDLSKLRPDEWTEFLRKVVRAFGDGIRAEVGGGVDLPRAISEADASEAA